MVEEKERYRSQAAEFVETIVREGVRKSFSDLLDLSELPMDMAIADLPLDGRSRNVFVKWGVSTVGELVKRGLDPLLARQTVGAGTATDVLMALLTVSELGSAEATARDTAAEAAARDRGEPRNDDAEAPQEGDAARGEPERRVDARSRRVAAAEIVDDLFGSGRSIRFEELVKEQVPNVSVERLALKTRSRNAIQRLGVQTVGDLMKRDVQELIRQRNTGRRTVIDVLATVSELAGSQPVPPAPVTFTQTHDLSASESENTREGDHPSDMFASALLGAGHEDLGVPSPTPTRMSSEDLTHYHALREVVATLRRLVDAPDVATLLGRWIEADVGHVPYSLTQHVSELEGWAPEYSWPAEGRSDAVSTLVMAFRQLDDREQLIIRARYGKPSGRRTLADLGDELGVSRERVRQMERTTVEHLSEVAAEPPTAELLEAVGEAVHPLVAEGRLAACVKERIPDFRFLDASLADDLVWLLADLGGLSRSDIDGFIGTRSGVDEVLAALAGLELGSSSDEVREELESCGVHATEVAALLRALKWREVRGRLLPLGSTQGDLVTVVMTEHGEPLEVGDVAAVVGSTEGAIRNVLTSDERFVRTDYSKYGLRQWGLREYSGITDAITSVLEERGGEAEVADIIDIVTSRFSVIANSVRSYAKSAEFVSLDRGRIRLRRPEEPPEDRDLPALERCSGCLRFNDAWAVRIEVTDKLLQGFSPVVPDSFAAHLGAGPLETIEVPSAMEPISVVRSALNSTIGRLRVVAQGEGLEPGDQLFVIAASGGGGPVSFASAEVTEPHEDIEWISAMLALNPKQLSRADAATRLALPPDAPRSAVFARLRARNEDELAGRLERVLPPDEDTGDSIADILGL